jgi:hypothetical protein
MAILATLQSSLSGVQSGSFVTAAAGGDEFFNVNERTLLFVWNLSGSSVTVTITPAGSPGGLTLAAVTASVPAARLFVFGPFPAVWFNNASNRIAVGYSAVTSVTVAAVSVGE